MKTLVAILGLSLLLLGGFAFYLTQRNAATAAQLTDLKAAQEALSAQTGPADGERIDASELALLKSEQQEAIRLRGELIALKQQAAEANNAASSAQRAATAAEAKKAQAQKAAAAQQQLPQARVFQSQANTFVPTGQSLVMGGWQTSAGTMTYAFVTPTLPQQGNNSVMVEAKIVELPQEAAARLSTMSGGGNGGQLTLTADQMKSLLKQWEQTPGAKVIGSPRIMTTSGISGSLSVGSMIETANGPVHLGPQLDVLPTVAPDGSQVQLTIDAKLGVPGAAP